MGGLKGGKSFFDNVFNLIMPETGEVAGGIARGVLKKAGMNEEGKIVNEVANTKFISSLSSSIAKGRAKDGLGELTEDELKKQAQNIVNKHKEIGTELLKELKEAPDKRKTEYIQQLADNYKKVFKDPSYNVKGFNVVNKDISPLMDASWGINSVMAYATEPGKSAVRWGAYGSVMVGGRLISGGTPFHNNTGERDIAGIPFI